MKYSLSLALLASVSNAFPSYMMELHPEGLSAVERKMLGDAAAYKKRGDASLEKRVGFEPLLQYVSNTGEHQFVAPDLSKDSRGPCPGLNAMANHGYLPHNGVATIQQFMSATYQGMLQAVARSTNRNH